MRIGRRLIMGAMCLACAMMLRVQGAEGGPKPRAAHPELWDGFTDFAAGKTLAELRTKAKPTLVGDDKSDDATWVWIGKSSVDTPVFTLAAPYKTPEGAYAILQIDHFIPVVATPRFRERIVKIMSEVPEKPATTYASIAATHPVHDCL